jgi:hypothetical protein
MNIRKTVAIAAATGLLTALALPALADTTIYGSIRTSAAYDTTTFPKAGGNATFFNLGLDPTSRLGVNVNQDNLFVNVELGIGDGGKYSTADGTFGGVGQSSWLASGGGATLVYTRHAYGTYKFDAGTLLVGQTWNPYTTPTVQSLNGDQANSGFGSLYDGRLPQIKFTLNNGVYIDLIRQTNQVDTAGAVANPPAGNTVLADQNSITSAFEGKWLMPKIAIGYDGKTGNYSYGAGIMGSAYTDSEKRTTNAGLVYVHAKAQVADFDALINLGAGINISALGLNDGASYLKYNSSATQTQNVTTVSALVVAGYKLSQTLKVNAGIGGGTSSNSYGGTGATATLPALNYLAFVNAPVTLAKNVYVTPEIDYVDNLKATTERGAAYAGNRSLIYGAQVKIDF